jgi:hypothetical protein
MTLLYVVWWISLGLLFISVQVDLTVMRHMRRVIGSPGQRWKIFWKPEREIEAAFATSPGSANWIKIHRIANICMIVGAAGIVSFVATTCFWLAKIR